jgi:hypothetical protein
MMKDIIGWLVLGTALVYLGIAGIIEPIDNRVTSVVGPYLITPLGLILFFRGFFMLIKAKGINAYQKFAMLVSYPAMTLGVLLVFAHWLIEVFWVRLVIGCCLLGIGILLRLSINWVNKSHKNL